MYTRKGKWRRTCACSRIRGSLIGRSGTFPSRTCASTSNAGEKRLEHELKSLVHLVLRLTLLLHAAPPYDDWEHFDHDAGIVPFRRVGTVTGMVKVDKAARRVLKAQGYLERKQGYLECGRPYGTGLVATTAGHKRSNELFEITPSLSRFDGLEDERLVDECLDTARKFGTHLCAAIYECITPEPGTRPAQKWKTPRQLAAMWDVHDNFAPLVSGGLSKLADMGLVLKVDNRYKGATWDCPASATDWRGACPP